MTQIYTNTTAEPDTIWHGASKITLIGLCCFWGALLQDAKNKKCQSAKTGPRNHPRTLSQQMVKALSSARIVLWGYVSYGKRKSPCLAAEVAVRNASPGYVGKWSTFGKRTLEKWVALKHANPRNTQCCIYSINTRNTPQVSGGSFKTGNL